MDVNVLAIFLVEDHPGHEWVDAVVMEGLAGRTRLLASDVLPLRARWVLTSRWGIPLDAADASVRSFLAHRHVRYVGASRATLLRAFELADHIGTDVYDAFLLALAEQHEARSILTTDAGLRRPCEALGLTYENPVPPSVLRRFVDFERPPGR